MLGELFGNYRVVEQLGQGNMGVVYVGRHETLGRRVIVKVLQPELSRNGDMVQRFFKEAQAATAIRNPGIVHVFDFGTTHEGRAYVVTELLEGQSLSARLQQRRLDFMECCRLGRQIANVMQAAHAAGITHRDLKPDNLFLVPDPEVIGGERVKVLDFGLAKLAGEAYASGIKTRTGLVMGSPTYMSPEQCRSLRTADARSDIYALGCILFEMACGRPPFTGTGMGDIVGAHLHVQPPEPQSLAPAIPPELAALISQMLAKQPDARPQTMTAVSQALDELLRQLGGLPARPSTPPPMRQPTPQPVATTLPPDATDPPAATVPARPARPQAPQPQPGRPAASQPRPLAIPPPSRPGAPITGPTIPRPAPARRPAQPAPPDPAPSTMVLSDPTLLPISEPTIPPETEATLIDPAIPPMAEPMTPEPTMAEPTLMPVSDPPPPPPTRPQALSPMPPAPPAPGVQPSWPSPPGAPSPPDAQAPWLSPPGAPPPPGAQTPWPSPISPANHPAALPDIAALQRAFVRGVLIVVALVVVLAIILGIAN